LSEEGDHACSPGNESQVDGEGAAPDAANGGLGERRHEKRAVIE
jgi:hypothetical protein